LLKRSEKTMENLSRDTDILLEIWEYYCYVYCHISLFSEGVDSLLNSLPLHFVQE
jgi:uncharacterized protein YuzB (UPF0349 family)